MSGLRLARLTALLVLALAFGAGSAWAAAPVAGDDSGGVNEGASTAVSVLGNDSDPDGDDLDPGTLDIVAGPANGTAFVTGSTITYTHDGSETTSDSFTYTVQDTTGATSNTATVSITVTPVNDPPTAVANGYNVNEDGVLNVAAPGVVGNDTDPEGSSLTADLVTNVTHGSLTLNADGSFSYTPDADYSGPDAFTYRANDGTVDSAPATVTITVDAVNDAPTAVGNVGAVNEGGTTSINVAGNDTDVDGTVDVSTVDIVSGPSNGTATPNLDGTVDYDHDGSETTSDSFTYRIQDNAGAFSNAVAVTITVNPVNDAPTAAANGYNVDEDDVLNVAAPGVLGNDSDPESSPITAVLVTNVTHGSLTLNADGSFDYTPTANYSGPDGFTYKANDGALDSAPASVTITVNPVNDPPTAAANGYNVNEDATLSPAAPGVLGNDTDPESNPLTAVLVTDVANGALTLNSNGSFSYTPDADYNGSDEFTYRANDGTANSAPATVTITVNPVNDPPTAGNDGAVVAEGGSTAIAVTENDDDLDGSLDVTSITVVGAPAHGTATPNLNGTVTYTHDGSETTSDSFTYRIQDNLGALSNTATVTVTVTAVNEPPVAVADGGSVSEGGTTNIDVAGNDTDVDGTVDVSTVDIVSGPSNGTATPNLDGTVDYDHDGSETTSDSFTYRIQDNAGANSNTVAVSITVNPVNDPPAAVADGYSVDEDATLNQTSPGVLGNDSDPEGSSLTAVLVTNVIHGSLTLNANGSFSYTPAANYNGSDAFTYKANDGALDSAPATVTITVNAVNDAPTAVANGYNVDEDATLNPAAPGVLGNDTDPESNPLTAVLVTDVANGALTLNSNGSFSYTPDADYNGSDEFTYRANDGTANSAPATVTITVNPVNDPPTAGNDGAVVAEGGSTAIAVTENDDDLDGSLDVTSITVVGAPAHGTATPNLNGTVTYTHDGSETTSDSFTYRIQDNLGALSNTATVTVTVTAVNESPTAVGDTYNVNEDGTLNQTAPGVLGNDTDPESNPLTAVLVTDVAHGALTLNPNGSFTYTPTANYSGPDAFTYKANDGTLDSPPATVTITVNAGNDAPTAVADAYNVNEDGTLNQTAPGVLGNDTDPESNPLTAVLVTDVAHGSLTLNPNGSFTYTPTANYSGPDAFTYKANDGTLDSAPATVTITVNAGNDAPTAVADAYNVNEDATLNQAGPGVLGNDTDPESNPLTAVLVTDVAHGALTLNPNGSFSYTPTANYSGPDAFTYKANDGTLDSPPATVTITVNVVNDAPTATADAYNVNEDATLNQAAPGVLGNDTDPESNPLTAVLVTDVAHGALTLNPNGSFAYTPTANYSGPDAFTYRANDGTLDSPPATVTITVNVVNDAPTATADAYNVNEDATLNQAAPGVLGNDTDPESNPLTAVLVTDVAHGALTLNPNGSFAYTPTANYSGPDAFTYRANDGTVNSAPATVTITVGGVNDAPTAMADAYNVNEDGVLTATLPGVLGNDTDPESNPLTAVLVTDVAHGSLTLNPNGSFSYTPAANYSGPDAFTYKANDGTLDSPPATVTITVNAVNDPPVAANNSGSVTEGGATNVNVIGNDSDIDDGLDPTSVEIVTAPDNGTAVPNPDGTVTYTHDGSETANDTFTYRVRDLAGAASNAALVSITVLPANDPPVAAADAGAANEGGSTTINVAANDNDPEGALDLGSVQIVAAAAHGTTTVNPNGTVGYTHDGSETTSDSFTYTIDDGPGATSNTATVTVTVTPANDPPVAVNDGGTVAEGSAIGIDVVANDTDAEGALDLTSVEIVAAPTHGTAVPQPSGTVTYTHDGGESASDAFTYRIKDGTGTFSNTATVTVTVTGVNDPPVAVNDPAAVSEGGSTTINVAVNDTDPESALNLATVQIVSAPAHGTATVNLNGTVGYTHDGGETTSDTFTYTIRDVPGAISNTATVTITVTPANDAPVAVNDAAGVSEAGSVNINVVANDTDADGGVDPSSVQVVSAPTHGALVVNANGTVDYTHDGGETTSDSFTYTVEDLASATSNTATVSITVTPVNDAPVANNDSRTLAEGATVAVNVAGNDLDAEGALDLTSIAIVSAPAHGTATPQANGTVSYTHDGGESTSDSFTYTIEDQANAVSNTATVTITVSPGNDPPTASNDAAGVAEAGSVPVNVIANDTDAEDELDPASVQIVTAPTRGTAAPQPDGTVLYTHNGSETTSDSFTYTVEDLANATSNTATVSITVTPVNDPPAAVTNGFNVAEDNALNVAAPGVLGNDTDAENNPLTAVLDTGVSHGTLSLNPDGSFVYTPAANYNGPDQFTYHANDGAASSTPVAVTLTVTAVNDAPVAAADAYNVNEDATLTVTPGIGVLVNDTDVENNVLTAVLDTDVSHGTLALNGSGSFVYTPAANYNGPDQFTYHASDGTASSNVTTVTITVGGTNDPPVAAADAYGATEDGALNVAAPGVLANDTDPDLQSLTAVVETSPSHGALTLNADGSFTYTPAANYNGLDTFSYRASDGSLTSAPATVTLTVAAVNDAPTAQNDAYSVNEDNTLTVSTGSGVLINDSDVDAGTTLSAVLDAGPTQGILTLNVNGSFGYTPNANFNGSDSFTYRASDGTLPSGLATVTITVNAANDAPTGTADGYAVDEDAVLTVAAPGVLANDTDVEGSPLTAVLGTNVAHGTLTLNADGSFTYTPTANYNGPDSFTYRASDGITNSASTTVTLTVNPVNDPPAAAADAFNVNEDAVLTVSAPGVLANDTDLDGAVALTAVLGTNVAHGTLTLNADGSFTYTPAADYNGPDGFTYRANDGTLPSGLATVTLTVNATNDTPVAVADAHTTPEDTGLSVAAPGVLANDTDLEGTTLTAQLETGPSHGLLTLNSNGSFNYTPSGNYNGSDSFTYRAGDGTASSAPATVSITITPVNDSPTAAPDPGFTTAEDTPLVVGAPGVLDNDTDVDGDTLSAILTQLPSNGTVTLNSDGSFTYTPNTNFNGTDLFRYQAGDGTATSNAVQARVTVNAVNDPPVAVADAYNVDEDGSLVVGAGIGVLVNDTDVEAALLTAVLDAGVTHGTLTLNPDGSFTYTPAAGYNGPDAFTYHVSDGAAASSPVAVAITVGPINDPPAAAGDSGFEVDEDAALNVAAGQGVLGNDTDPENNPLTAVLETNPQFGAVTLNPDGSFSYTPEADYNGPDQFTYRADDGSATSEPATVRITVRPLNDAPVSAIDAFFLNEDASLDATPPGVLNNDTDVDGNALTSVLDSGPAHGTLTLDPDGSFLYTPVADYHGPDAFTYHATDGTLSSSTVTVTITVRPVNDPPAAVDDDVVVSEGATQIVSVLANDSDVDGDDLTVLGVTQGANGAVSTNGTTVTYVHNHSQTTSDVFTYTVGDGTVQVVATVNVAVSGVNDPPVTTADLAYVIPEDSTLVVAAPGVLGNDTDADGDTLTAVPGATTTKGTLTLAHDGSFTYVPNANVTGQDLFTYRANDGTVNSGLTTARITITAVNDPPAAANDTYNVNEDGSLVVSAGIGVLVNDTDVEANPLTAVLDVGPQHGALTLNTGGSFTYTPNANYNGPDAFTYHAADTAPSNVATVTITVNPVNDAPVAGNDAGYTTPEDAPLTVAAPGLLLNDTDLDGDTLRAAVETPPAHGTVTVNPDGSFTYTPTANYNGPDGFSYRARDGGPGDVGDVALTVTPVNDAPLAVNDPSYTTPEDTTLTVTAPGVLGNDTDVDGNPLTASLVSPATTGTAVLNADGSFTYTPPANYNGAATFTYRVNDGTVNSPPATVTVTVSSRNDPPTATADGGFTVNEDQTLNAAAPGVLGNDADAEGNPLTAVLGASAASGTVTLNANGSFAYTPNANFNGSDSFTYRASDGTSTSALATVSITVSPVNDAPAAAPDPAYAVDEDAVLNISAPAGVLANDSDVDGNPLTAAVETGPAHGVLVLNASGSFTYTPAANYNGPDSFTYRAGDGTATSGPATASINVRPTNDPPLAAADGVYGVGEDSTLAMGAPGVLGNDADPDQDPLIALVATPPAHGNLALHTNGSFSYVPGANFNGTDGFTYYAVDGSDSSLASVALNVRPVNDAPVADAETYVVAEDDTLEIPAAAGVLTGDTDLDGDPLTAVLGTPPVHGSVTLQPDGSLVYMPHANYFGPDNFSYRASDGRATSNQVTVLFSVTAVNDPPVAQADAYSLMEDSNLGVTSGQGILANDSDVELNSLRATLLSGVAHGSLSLNVTGAFSYTPDQNFFGADSFAYRLSDEAGGSAGPTLVRLLVEAVNDPPVAVFDNFTIKEDSTLTLAAPGVMVNDSDVEGDPLSANLERNPNRGTVTLNPDGSFTYDPEPNFYGTDLFRYYVDDGETTSGIVQVRFTITAVNDPPTTVDDFYNVTANGQLSVTAGQGVLVNDADPEANQFTAVKDTNPASGTVAFNTSGSFTYTPNPAFVGMDSFTYHAIDGPGAVSSPATVHIEVLPPGSPSIASMSSRSDREGDAVGLQVTASDPDEDPLTFSAVNLPPGLSINAESGLISGTIACGAAAGSPYQVQVTADDGVDGDATTQFNWTVTVLPAPSPLGSFSALTVRTSPDADGTVPVTVSWNAGEVRAGDEVVVYRKALGNYPEYSDAGSVAPNAPLDPAQAEAQGWTLTGITAPGQTDNPGTRDAWYYVAFVENPCDRPSSSSNRPPACLSYYLGDVAPGAGDNRVETTDVSVLGNHYGVQLAPGDSWNILDVGPTGDRTPTGVPTTDNRIQFEDLMIFALNYGAGTGASPAPSMALSGAALTAAITLRLPEALPGIGETFEVNVEVRADGQLTGFTLPLSWNAEAVEPVGLRGGELLGRQSGAALALTPEPGTLDAASIGAPLTGEGTLATWTFRVVGSGEPGIAADSLAARDGANRPLEVPVTVVTGSRPTLPAATRLLPAAPNPFLTATAVAFELAGEGRVVLQVYGVDGRLVRTLVDEARPAGRYEERWDARDETGREVASGTYFLRLVTPLGARTQRVVRLR